MHPERRATLPWPLGSVNDVVGNEEYQQDAAERNITTVQPRIGDEFGQYMQEQDELVGELIQYFVEGGFMDAGTGG